MRHFLASILIALAVIAGASAQPSVEQRLDNLREAENQARAVLGTVQEAPRASQASDEEAASARSSLTGLIVALVKFREAVNRADGSEVAAFEVVKAQESAWRTSRNALAYTDTEREFIDGLDLALGTVNNDSIAATSSRP